MTELRASRTIVKSPPELWAECSDAPSLARHLGQFGEIRITRLEPETAIAWEGDRARGTVRIEPAGWGTRVILTAVADAGAVAETVQEDEAGRSSGESAALEDPPVPPAEAPIPPAEDGSAPARDVSASRPRRFARLRAFLRRAEPSAEPKPPPAADADTPAGDAPASDTEAVLAAALDSLGQAHHRPFSRG